MTRDTSTGTGAERASANAAELLFRTAESRGRHTAVIEPAGVTSFSRLAARTRGVASQLQRAGVQPGDRVGIFLQRGSDAAAAFFGALAAGAIAVNVNEHLRSRQIEHIAAHSGARALLTSSSMLERLPRKTHMAAGTLLVEHIETAAAFGAVPRIEADAAHIIYTSGSTGLPKGVTVSHGNLWAGTEAVVAYVGIGADDRLASLLPFSFDYGLNQLLCSVATGAPLVVEHSPVPHRIVDTLRRRKVTVLAAVPPLWLQLLGVRSFTSNPLPSLRAMTNSGGRLPIDAVRTLRHSYPRASLLLMYGLTEAFRSTYLPPGDVDRKPGSIGRAIPGAEILVVRDGSRPCGAGEVGELVHRGPTVALGYWDDPETTDRVFRPNPLRPDGVPPSERVVFSGDLVYRDDEGDLFFVGRSDKMIKTLGYRVSPDEVADVLYGSGEVAEAVVTSEPDEARGARIVAIVVLCPGGSVERLEAFCTAEMPRYMQPARIETRDSLPRTPSGKHDAAAAAAAAARA